MIQAIQYAMAKLGIKTMPDKDATTVLLDHILKNYGNHTPDEIKLAFDMAILGKLEVDPTHYENFSCAYFSKIMSAYRAWASREIKQQPATPALPAPKEEMTDQTFLTWIATLKADRMPMMMMPPMVYEWLDKTGRIKHDDKQKWEYMRRAIEFTKKSLQANAATDPGSRKELIELERQVMEKNLEGPTADKLRKISKKMIVFDYVYGTRD